MIIPKCLECYVIHNYLILGGPDVKKRLGDIFVFSLSLIALIISFALLRMFGAYEIEYGDGALIVDGGWLMIIMNVVRIIVLLVLNILSGIRLWKKPR